MECQIGDCDKRIRRGIEEAMNIAEQSTMLMRVGAALMSGGIIMKKSCNVDRSKLGKFDYCSVHAEMNVLKELKAEGR